MRPFTEASPAGSNVDETSGHGSIAWLVATLALAILAIAVFAGVARAATVYSPTGGSFEGEPSLTGQIAIDGITGDIIGRPTTPERGLAIYGPKGPGAEFSAYFNEYEEIREGVMETKLGVVESIAIDQTSRSLYALDYTFGRIVKYSISGSGTVSLSPDTGFVSPTLGSGPGQLGSLDQWDSMAIDPTTGDLLVADWKNQRVNRYDPNGSFISSFPISNSEGPKTATSIAVDSAGRIYAVVSTFEGELPQPNPSPSLVRYTSAGVAEPGFGPEIPYPKLVTIDPVNGNVVVVGRTNQGPSLPARLYVVAGGAVVQDLDFPESTESWVSSGLAAYGGRLYVAFKSPSNEGGGIFTYETHVGPDIAANAPSEITAETAVISGTVNPLGQPTTYHVEYSREGGPTQETAETSVGEGGAPAPFSTELTDLLPNSEYTERVIASNAQVSLGSASRTFRTLKASPRVSTGGAANPSTTATLEGTVNPLGQQTTYYFEYGTTTGYGARVPTDRGALAGSGRAPVRVSQELGGLQTGGTYHYRLVATNDSGTSFGEDRSFTTTAPSGQRNYELVTPNEKGDVNVYRQFLHATPSGNAISYEMQNVIPGTAGSFPKFPRYTSTRVGDAWNTAGLEPYNVPAPGNDELMAQDVLAVSEDGTRAVVMSTAVLASGGRSAGTNLYLYDIASGSYETIYSSPDPVPLIKWVSINSGGPRVVVGGTPNFSRVYLQPGVLLNHIPNYEFIAGVNTPSLYEWSKATGFKVAAEDASYAAWNGSSSEQRLVSEDGSVAFYIAYSDYSLHALDDGQNIAVSEGPFASFVAASADGRYSVYEENGILYRFDLSSRERVVISNTVLQGLTVSRDGSTVYFVNITPKGTFEIEAWREGQVQPVAESSYLGVPYLSEALKSASPNGDYFAFQSTLPLTGYENEGVPEIFRYDFNADELQCASCRTDDDKPTGVAEAGAPETQFEFYQPRRMLDNGELFFDTPDPLVPNDVNSRRDVYSFNGRVQTLISTGAGNANAYFADSSESGDDVFFVTADRLVKGDTNDDVDIYDARVGGGIASQQAEAPAPACISGGCRGAAAVDPTPTPAGSESTLAKPPHKPKHHAKKTKKVCRASRAKGKRRAKSKCGKARGHKKSNSKRGRGK